MSEVFRRLRSWVVGSCSPGHVVPSPGLERRSSRSCRRRCFSCSETPKHRTSQHICQASAMPMGGPVLVHALRLCNVFWQSVGSWSFTTRYPSSIFLTDSYSECYTWKGSCWSVVSPLVAFGMPSQLLGACGRKAMKGMGEGSATPWASWMVPRRWRWHRAPRTSLMSLGWNHGIVVLWF